VFFGIGEGAETMHFARTRAAERQLRRRAETIPATGIRHRIKPAAAG
jgi:hypothetical protein